MKLDQSALQAQVKSVNKVKDIQVKEVKGVTRVYKVQLDTPDNVV